MLKGYRTVIFNVTMTVIMALSVWQPDAQVPTAADVNTALQYLEEAVALFWGVGNLALRAVTNTSIFNKEE